MRRTALVLGLAAAALALPSVAMGAVTVSLSNGTLTIAGSAADEDIAIGSAGSNELGPTTDVSGGGVDMVAGAGCQGFGQTPGPPNDNSVFCPTNNIQRISVTLGDGDDSFRATDTLPMTVDGGPGDDEIGTGRGPDVVLGGPGEDEIDIDVNVTAGTSSEVDGGSDDDELLIGRDARATVVRGGGGTDTASYRFAGGAKTVSLDNVANDGGANEGDDVRSDVEVVIGTAADDTLIGSGGPNTLDGAGGTDRLEGLGGPDTLIGGPGVNDATFGGEGNDAIMLRDGLVDACPSGGAGTNTFDLDLADQGIFIAGRLVLPRCISQRIVGLPTDLIAIGAVDEGPNVRMTIPSPAVRRDGVRVRLACPAVLRKPCAGRLRVFTFRGRRVLASTSYSVRPGRATTIVLPLSATARRAALGAGALRVVSVEKGRSKLGPKTTIRFARSRGS
jgi:hypothetical protein